VALTEKKRCEIDQLHAFTVDIQRKIERAIDEAEEVLPPGALPGMLKNSMMSVMVVRDVLWWMLHHTDPAATTPSSETPPTGRLHAVRDGDNSE